MAAIGLAPIANVVLSCLSACGSCLCKKKKKDRKKKKGKLSVIDVQSSASLDAIDESDGDVIVHNYTTVTCCGSTSKNANEDDTYTASGDQRVTRQQEGAVQDPRVSQVKKKNISPSPVSE